MNDAIDADGRSEQELVRLFHTPEQDLQGRALGTIYRRYSGAVLDALHAAGLSCADAQERIGTVFLQALNRVTTDQPRSDLTP